MVIFEQASYMMKLIEEQYFNECLWMEREGLEAETPAGRMPEQCKCEGCNCGSGNRWARPEITVEEKTFRFLDGLDMFLNTPLPTNGIIQQNLQKGWCSSPVKISCKCCQKL